MTSTGVPRQVVDHGPGAPVVERLDRTAMQRWLPRLTEWLLPGSAYGVQHTWPQLYRSDGAGTFFVLRDDAELVAHCAVRLDRLLTQGGEHTVALLGSVATAPDRRRCGHATTLLRAAIAHCEAAAASTVLLWAERPELYARVGFEPGPGELMATIARRPLTGPTNVRLATVADHAALHALHERKPLRIARSAMAMSGLLTTPGLWTFVLEQHGRIIAYACCGKGADLQGVWHEIGGDDADVAMLLPAAMLQLEQTEAQLLVPPYRPGLLSALGRAVVATAQVAGPMVRGLGTAQPVDFWIDGLDSV